MKRAFMLLGGILGIASHFVRPDSFAYLDLHIGAIVLFGCAGIMHHIDNKFKDKS